MPTGWPSLADVRTFLRMQPDPVEDGVIQAALDAAIDYGQRRTNYKYDLAVNPLIFPTPPSPVVPALANYAATVHAALLYRRRDSTDGTIGFSDVGIVRVTGRDPTVESNYAALGPMVVG